MIYYCYRFIDGKRRGYICTISTSTEIHLDDTVGAGTLGVISGRPEGGLPNLDCGSYRVVRREIHCRVGQALAYNLDLQLIHE